MSAQPPNAPKPKRVPRGRALRRTDEERAAAAEVTPADLDATRATASPKGAKLLEAQPEESA